MLHYFFTSLYLRKPTYQVKAGYSVLFFPKISASLDSDFHKYNDYGLLISVISEPSIVPDSGEVIHKRIQVFVSD